VRPIMLPLRGSSFNNTSNSGVAAVNLNNPRSDANNNISFRSALPLLAVDVHLRMYTQYIRAKGVLFHSKGRKAVGKRLNCRNDS
jgi:hypothetical protein